LIQKEKVASSSSGGSGCTAKLLQSSHSVPRTSLDDDASSPTSECSALDSGEIENSADMRYCKTRMLESSKSRASTSAGHEQVISDDDYGTVAPASAARRGSVATELDNSSTDQSDIGSSYCQASADARSTFQPHGTPRPLSYISTNE